MKHLSETEALHKAAAYCSRTERCIDDIKKKLTLWNIEFPVQNKIIQRLLIKKFIDEQRFCRFFVNDKSKFNKWGYNKIKFELKKKNIPDELIESALDNINPKENKERLIQLLKNKKKSVKGKSDYEIQQKLIRFAIGKGFQIDEIIETVKFL